MGLCKVCSTVADWQRECWYNCKWTVWKVNTGYQLPRQGCYRKWKLDIRLTTLKPNGSHPNDTPHLPLGQRSIGLQSQTWKSCWLHFLIVKASSIMNLCLEEQLWMLLTTLRCLHVYGTTCEVNVMDGLCTATIQQVTWLWQCSNSWWQGKLH